MLSRKELEALSSEARIEFCQSLETPHDFRFDVETTSGLPRYMSAEFGIAIRLILPDRYQMGLSEAEVTAASLVEPGMSVHADQAAAMQPVHLEDVGPVWISESPVMAPLYERRTHKDYGNFDTRQVPVRITYDDATVFSEALNARIPTEAEWEYLCRGDSSDLFHWGNELPDYELIPQYLGQHARALTPIIGARNKLGFEALFWGEWVQDAARESYEPDAKIRENSRVTRGGANSLWPWQGCHEWLHCVSAGRRLVSSLEPGPGSWPPFNLDLEQSVRLAWPMQ